MKNKVNYSFLSAIFLLLVSNVFAQRTTDVENSKDCSLVSRFEGAIIEFYKETKWGTYKLPVDDKGKINFDSPVILKGKVTRIQYSVSPDNNPEYILHNYIKAFNNAGFTVLLSAANEELGVGKRSQDWNARYYGSGDAYFYNALNNGKFGLLLEIPNWKVNQAFIVANGEKDSKSIYISVYAVDHDSYTLINQDVIEVEAAETGMVTATSIDKGIKETGHIAIYDILFSGDKAEIKPESENALRNIAEFLKANADLKYFIVGHAAGIGDFSSGMTLSENRAKAVMNELTAKYGVNQNQLKAYGVGSLCPVSSNKTDEGRAKNRRVEIVEQ